MVSPFSTVYAVLCLAHNICMFYLSYIYLGYFVCLCVCVCITICVGTLCYSFSFSNQTD
jgi:hypothetical protein